MIKLKQLIMELEGLLDEPKLKTEVPSYELDDIIDTIQHQFKTGKITKKQIIAFLHRSMWQFPKSVDYVINRLKDEFNIDIE